MTDIERMAHMWNIEGLSMGQIGKKVHMSRHQVAGIIHRNREKFKRRNTLNERVKTAREGTDEPIVTAPQKANRRRKAFHAVKVAEEAAAAPVTPVEPEIDGKDYDAARLPLAKCLLDLESCHCRCPLNDGGPFLFCCAEVEDLSPYCSHHKRRSKGKGTISEQKAVTDARWAA